MVYSCVFDASSLYLQNVQQIYIFASILYFYDFNVITIIIIDRYLCPLSNTCVVAWNLEKEKVDEEEDDYILPKHKRTFFFCKLRKISSNIHELITPIIKVNSIMFH